MSDFLKETHWRKKKGRLEQNISRILFPLESGAVICLTPWLLKGMSDLPALRTGHPIMGSFGLAPDGLYHAPDVTTRTVSSYLTFSPLHRETAAWPISQSGMFSVALSSGRPESLLTTILPFGVRTFLPFFLLKSRRSNRLVYSSRYFYSIMF